MRVTQGAFSFLPDLTDAEISKQIEYILDHEWAVSLEHTDDPHPRNTYWDMWGHPMFDLRDPAGVMDELRSVREAYPQHYVRVNAFDSTHGTESIVLSFIVNRPTDEPGFFLSRSEGRGRDIHYTTNSYAVDRAPAGQRYAAESD
jgi:ribulose-bisphosphate carboxylase small chain